MSDEAAVQAAPVDEGNSVSRLAAGFEALDSVENSEPVIADPVVEEPAVEAPEEAEAAEPEATEPEETEEPAEQAAFDALTDERAYPTEDELREKYPRHVPKAFLKETAGYAAEAKEWSEAKAKLGGAEFIEPAAELTETLRKGDGFKTLEVIGNKFGQDDLLNVIGNAMYMAHEHKKTLTQPEYAGFVEGLNKLTNIAFQSEFGENVTPERVRELIQFDAIGAFEKLDKWIASDEIDSDEWDELKNLKSNPALAGLAKENAELKRQLEAKTKTVEPVKEPEIDNFFIKTAPESIDKVFATIVLKNSPLRDLPTDTAAMKEKKELFREQLKDKAVIAFNRSESAQKLKQGVKYGKQDTAVFKSEFSNAVNAAVMSTKSQTSQYEAILAELYGKTRNSQLTPKTVEKLTPTPIKQAPAAPQEGNTLSRLDAHFRSQTN